MTRLRGASRWSLDRIIDTAFAVALAAMNAVNMYFPEAAAAYEYPPPNPLQVVLGTLACLMFALRRTYPATTLFVVLVCTGIIAGSGWNAAFLPYALVFALYTIAAHKTLPWAIAGLLLTYAQITVLTVLRVPYFEDWYVFLTVAWYTAIWGAGIVMRTVRAQRDRERERALSAERTKALAAAEARIQERMSIARDMHDVVAHALSVMTVQAGLARMLLPKDPDAAAEAIGRAEDSARDATTDLRRMLSVLRADTVQAQLEPAPGTADLASLAASDDAELDVSGAVDDLPESLRLTVYRIVQEALTNARKHAPGSAVRVVVREQGGRVQVVVANGANGTNGAVGDSAGGIDDETDRGWGLAGLMERVQMYGGTFSSGRTDAGDFEVRVSM